MRAVLPSSAAAPADAVAAPAACLHCDAPLTGPWCAACGQRGDTGRLSVRALAGNALGELLTLDRGLPRTIRELTVHPGPMLRAYLAGKRVCYTAPGKLLLLTTAVAALAFLQLGMLDEMARGYVDGLRRSGDASATTAGQIVQATTPWINAIIVAVLPFMALGSWLSFRPARLTYAEHLAVCAYILSWQNLLFLATVFLWRVGATGVGAATAIYFLVGSAYTMWALAGVAGSRPLGGTVRGVLAQTIGYAAYLLFAMGAAVVGTVLWVIVTR